MSDHIWWRGVTGERRTLIQSRLWVQIPSSLQITKYIMQSIFNILAAILFLFFGVIWSKKGFVNIFAKFICFILAIIGIVLILQDNGYIIKQ